MKNRVAAVHVVGIIPARWGSTRFEGKALADLLGKPMIQHVYERASRARTLAALYVATDDVRIKETVDGFGGVGVLTRPDHPSGTDRIAEVAADLPADLVVNIQGDEPLLDPEMIDEAVEPLRASATIPMGTLMNPITDAAELADPNVVKVVVNRKGFALYFSRYPIPCVRDKMPTADGLHHRHVGLYVYRRSFLLRYARLRPTPLELAERLEQLRALEHGYRIRVVLTKHRSMGVDTPADLERVRELMRAAGV